MRCPALTFRVVLPGCQTVMLWLTSIPSRSICHIVLRDPYAMPGTDRSYGATRCHIIVATLNSTEVIRLAPSDNARVVPCFVLTTQICCYQEAAIFAGGPCGAPFDNFKQIEVSCRVCRCFVPTSGAFCFLERRSLSNHKVMSSSSDAKVSKAQSTREKPKLRRCRWSVAQRRDCRTRCLCSMTTRCGW